MRRPRLLALVSLLVLVAACARPAPRELLATTPFALAREHGRFVSIGDLHVFAITLGQGRDVLLLHGNPSSTYTWRGVIEPLAKRYRVHAIDLPGFGFSDKPEGAPYTTDWLAHRALDYLDAAGVDRAVIVGNSMGGHVASEIAMIAPERVSALVLIAASGLQVESDEEPPLAMRIATWPVIGPILRALPSKPLVASALRDAFYDPSRVTDTDVDVYYAALRSRGGLDAFLTRMGQSIPPDRADRVRTIDAPTLVITGDTDRIVDPAVSDRYHDMIADSELVIFDRTGHLPQEERPRRTVAEIERFLDDHPDAQRDAQ
jgi:pimeloyl-ACP methyl ester carboxylesterase